MTGSGLAAVYGSNVAVRGDTLVVSGTGSDATRSGRVVVFSRSGTVWTQQTVLTSSSQPDRSFGGAIAFDGETIVVASFLTPYATIFVRGQGGWTQQSRLTVPFARQYTAFSVSDEFVSSVAVSGDRLLLGGTGAYLYQRSGTTWTLQSTLHEPLLGAWDRVYLQDAVTLDGDLAMVNVERGSRGSRSIQFFAGIRTAPVTRRRRGSA